MYRFENQPDLPDFYLLFGGKLDPENRWVRLAKVVPWHLVEEDYRANRNWCKEHGIRLSGKPLGRPRELSKEEKKRQRQDETDRIPIEGKFGNVKRKGTLQRGWQNWPSPAEPWRPSA